MHIFNPSLYRHLVLYLFVKFILVAVLVSNFDFIFSQSYFNYPDLKDNLNCDMRSHNGLFSSFLCVFQIKDISGWFPLSLAFILNSLKDLAVLFLASSLISKRALFFLVLFLSAHPYLAIYHAKLTTDMFGAIAVVFVLFKAFRAYQYNFVDVIITAFLSGLRNSTIPMLGMFCAIGVVKNVFTKNYTAAAFCFLGGLSTIFFFFLPEELYSSALIESTGDYPFSISYFVDILGLEINIFTYFFSSILLVLSHAILLLGFREAVFTDFPEIFFPFTLNIALQLSVFAGLFFIHAIGLVFFFRKYVKRHREILLLLLIVFPGFLFVAHLRYFLPLIPIALWGFALFCDEILLSRAKLFQRIAEKF